jgi:hypothetical protein
MNPKTKRNPSYGAWESPQGGAHLEIREIRLMRRIPSCNTSVLKLRVWKKPRESLARAEHWWMRVGLETGA